jgi:hypothetical protein
MIPKQTACPTTPLHALCRRPPVRPAGPRCRRGWRRTRSRAHACAPGAQREALRALHRDVLQEPVPPAPAAGRQPAAAAADRGWGAGSAGAAWPHRCCWLSWWAGPPTASGRCAGPASGWHGRGRWWNSATRPSVRTWCSARGAPSGRSGGGAAGAPGAVAVQAAEPAAEGARPHRTGYELVGGRLLPATRARARSSCTRTPSRRAAHALRRRAGRRPRRAWVETAFRFTTEGHLQLLLGRPGLRLRAGRQAAAAAELLPLAEVVYKQL